MNKITTTAGLLALGAVSLKAQVYAPAAGSQEATKPWTVSAVLRGFYDDNYTTSPKDTKGIAGSRRDSFGFEVSPSANVSMIMDQTAFSLGYVYSLRWYEDREDDSFDQSHQVNAKLSHAFSPRYKIDVTDSFAIAQEPGIIQDAGSPQATFLRTEGDNIRNNAAGSFSAGITENLALVFGYSNLYYDYDQEGKDLQGSPFFGLNSESALLDRVEHMFTLNARQVILPKTVGVAGYQFQIVDYTSNDRIGIPGFAGLNYPAEARDSTSHFFYLGVDQGFTPTLNGSIRAGVQYTEYDNLDEILAPIPRPDDSQWTPYLDANITWAYLPGGSAQLGVKHQRNQTDVGMMLLPSGVTPPILDAESTTVYGSVSHRIFGGAGHGLVASLIGQYQHSNYENSVSPDFSDDYLGAGVNLTYDINRWVAAEIGYNYDRLNSDLDNPEAGGIPRSYTRNRVYIGIRGTY